METFLIILTAFGGAVIGFLLALALFVGPENLNAPERLQAICDYKGGEVQGDVCIKDGSVITIDIPGDN